MLNSNSKIVKAQISALPQGFADPLPEVTVTTEDGATGVLFTYYPDEISFTPEELVGLTVREAHALRLRKDVAYLQS